MTLDEIIECIKEVKEDYWEDDGYGYATADCQRITTALDEAMERLEQTRWIPVSERLPEIHNYMQEYIVAIKGNLIRTAFFTETNGKSWWSIDNVTYWMPLPKPPKMSEIPTGAEGREE